jgi:UPF0755 protein
VRRIRDYRLAIFLLGVLLAPTLAGCASEPAGPEIQVHVPHGTSFSRVAAALEDQGIIRNAFLFRLYARFTGDADRVQAGTYGFQRGTPWSEILEALRLGRVMTNRIVIPEGWELRFIAPRIAAATGADADSLLRALMDTTAGAAWGVPGPNLEGYLYPATYSVPAGAPPDTIIARMIAQYRTVWTPERRALLEARGLSERELVTLASIVEREARHRDEMPRIAAVFHNRLRIGYRLDADPTVQYALGEHQSRLLYAHIDSVADHPYNTYRRRGLPPGPIGSPSSAAIDATLEPEETDYLYFVARPDGRHVFTRSLAEHNRARVQVRREAEALQRERERRAREAPPAPAVPAPAPAPAPVQPAPGTN